MDELEISGKRYLSTRRAGKEHRYHSDYIGQLIRSGKVAGTKVGRSWYVEAESLADYLGKEKEKEKAKSIPAPVLQIAPIVEPAPREEKSTPPMPVSVPEKEVGSVPIRIVHAETPHPQTEEQRESRIPTTVLDDSGVYSMPTQKQKMGLVYMADDAPLLPEIAPMTNAYPKPFVEHAWEEPKEELPVAAAKKHGVLAPALTLLAVGAVVTVGVAFASVYVRAQVSIESGKPASVGYVFK